MTMHDGVTQCKRRRSERTCPNTIAPGTVIVGGWNMTDHAAAVTEVRRCRWRTRRSPSGADCRSPRRSSSRCSSRAGHRHAVARRGRRALVPLVAFGLPSFEAGRWWTPGTGAFFAIRPWYYLPMAGSFALLVGWAEYQMGTRLTAAVTVGGHLFGVLGACLFLVAVEGPDWPWSVADGRAARRRVLGGSAGGRRGRRAPCCGRRGGCACGSRWGSTRWSRRSTSGRSPTWNTSSPSARASRSDRGSPAGFRPAGRQPPEQARVAPARRGGSARSWR